MNFFSSAWNHFILFIAGVGSYLKPFVEQFMRDEMKMVVKVATEAVAKVAADSSLVTWQDKLGAAVAYCETELVKQGISVATTEVINAVQVIVTQEKAKEAADAPVTSGPPGGA